MKGKLVFHEVMIDWWKLTLDLVAFLAINLYFVFILNRLLIALFLLPLVGIIRLYNSPRCMVSRNTAVLYSGRRTVKRLQEITAVGILSKQGEQPQIFLCGEEKTKIEKYAHKRKKEDGNDRKTYDTQRKWEDTLLLFISQQAKKSEKIILIPYSHCRFKRLTSFFGAEISEEVITEVLNNHTHQGTILCLRGNI